MRNALWAALLLGIVAVAAAADKPAPAIINGQDAQRGRYRYIVSLRPTDDETFHFCGGTLIHPRVVLTAAHCVRNETTGIVARPAKFLPYAYIGGYETDQASQFEKISVQKTEVNPNFVTGNSKTQKDWLNYDVALMLLPRASKLPRVKLVGPSKKPALPVPAGTEVTVIGWGSLTDPTVKPPGAIYPEKLQQLSMTLLSNQECKNRMGSKHNFATNTMVCAAHDKPPKGNSCAGDSGGPLIVRGADASKDYQIGIVSWGEETCAVASVFSDIGMLFNWIDAQVFEWTGERLTPWSPPPPPFKPVTGTVLANNVGTGFDGKPVTYTGAKGAPLDIISSVPAKGMGWYLNGILTDGTTPGSQALGYVAWSYGATLAAQAGPNGRLAVTLNNKRIHPGHPPNLGQLVTIKYPKDSCRRGWCADRLVEITVRPFIKVAITQPWIPGANWGAWGSFAPYLQVKVTLLQKPVQQPTGVLGQTILV